MPTDIHGLPPASLPPSGDRPRVKDGQQESGSSTARSENPAPTDTVSLTDVGMRLAEVGRVLESAPVVDVQRVNEVKQAVSEGRYQVDPARVADKLLAFENALPAKPKA